MATCGQCGKCCWNWVSGDPNNGRCEFLGDDDRTCAIYDDLAAHNLHGACFPAPELRVCSSLPPDCAYAVEWEKQGLIEADPERPGRWRLKE